MNKIVENYFVEGCLRCKLGATPACKVNTWKEELAILRHLVLETDLKEECKWGVPCYTYEGKNVVNVSAFKSYACLSFFKGALLKDPAKILTKAGENSQTFRLLKFTDPAQIFAAAAHIKSYIAEAIELEKTGQKIIYPKNPEPRPEELLARFEIDPALKKAFEALSPGRQRGYIIYFSQPKKSESKLARIEKSRPKILNGEGLNDRYKK
jgi:uncharacterized protein YdeI (YjbR/CyaY-like superfamily)